MGHAVIDRREGSLALCLAIFLSSVYFLTFSGIYHSSDEMAMLVATDSLVRRGAWDIELLRWMGEQQGSFGPDGHLYSRKGIGTTLAALPLYGLALQTHRLGNVQTAMLTHGLVTAWTGALLYLFLRRLRYDKGPALGTALAYGLATMAWPYARYLFSESLAGLGLMLSAYSLVCFQGTLGSRGRQGARSDWVSPFLAGTGLALALLARLNNAIVAPWLGLFLVACLWRQHGRDLRAWLGPVVLFGLPVLAALALSGWYNMIRFGDPLTTGYLPQERFATPFFEGLYGLTFSPGKGLFWYNPILLATLAAWPAFVRRHRAEALLCAAIVLSNLFFYAPWYLWWAGHSWGPRFLVAILPLAALPLAPALGAMTTAAGRRRGTALALAVLLALSLGVQCLGVAVDFNLYLEDVYAELGLYHPATLFSLAYSPLLRQVAYLQPGNLDLAWARGDSPGLLALAPSLLLVLVAGWALRAAWRGRTWAWWVSGLLSPLVVVLCLVSFAPAGDMAAAAHRLADMEGYSEAEDSSAAEYSSAAVVLTDPALTEAFQDAYDGRLAAWGVPSRQDLPKPYEAAWEIGYPRPLSGGEEPPAPVSLWLQEGQIGLALELAPGRRFDVAWLPAERVADDRRLGQLAEWVAVELGAATVRRGEVLSVTLYWRTLEAADRAYTVFVQAIDEAAVKAGQVDRLPCHGYCPTTAWQPGSLVGDRYDLLIRADAPPGRYRLISGLYDLATGEPLLWVDGQGNPLGPYLPVGSVEVRP
jgi:hypothetical protein